MMDVQEIRDELRARIEAMRAHVDQFIEAHAKPLDSFLEGVAADLTVVGKSPVTASIEAAYPEVAAALGTIISTFEGLDRKVQQIQAGAGGTAASSGSGSAAPGM